MCSRTLIIAALLGCATGFSPEVRERLIQEIEATRQCRHVMGLSVSVVQNQEVVFSEGFGVADQASRTAVTGETLFAIGSLTKAFTVELLTELLSNQEDTSFNWDTPITDILGDAFQMSDKIRTDHVTLGDLLAHKLGVPAYFLPLYVGFPENLTLHEFVGRIRFMCPTASFREKFMYNNYMYALAGYIAEQLAGDATWEELIRQRIFGPLGMTRSGFVHTDPSPEGLAKPYTRIDGVPVEVPMSTLRAVYPAGAAGAIASSAEDMARWMNHLLVSYPRKGRDDQLRRAAYEPQMALSMPDYEAIRRPMYPVAWFGQAYGYAWWFTNYRGYSTVQHPGGISTFSSQLVLIPDAKLGLYLANNGPQHPETTAAMRAVMMYLMDQALGLQPWLNVSTLCTYPRPWYSEYSPEDQPSPDDHEIHVAAQETFHDVSLQTYAGVYGHPAFGDVKVYVNATDSHLHVEYGRLGQAKLYQSRDPGAFTWVWVGDLRYDSTDLKVEFDDLSEEEHSRIMRVPVDYETGIYVDFIRDYERLENDPNTCYCNDECSASGMQSNYVLRFTLWHIVGLACCLLMW